MTESDGIQNPQKSKEFPEIAAVQKQWVSLKCFLEAAEAAVRRFVAVMVILIA